MIDKKFSTTDSNKPIGTAATSPFADSEFGRWRDVQRIFGIKRGILYRLIADRKIKSITLREPGKRFGCRLIYLPSVRAYLNGLLESQSSAEPVTPISQEQMALASAEL